MLHQFFRRFLSAAMCLCAAPAVAQDVGDIFVGNGVSILGATIEGAYQIDPNYRLRGIFMGGLNVDSEGEDDDGNSFEYDIAIAASAVVIDYFPTGTGWHWTGGLLFDLSDISGVGRGADTEPFVVNGETFESGRVDAEMSFSRGLAPILTAGYEYDFGNDWLINGEVGAVFIGGIDTTYTANSTALQNAIDTDADFVKARSDAADLSILPYIGITISYRF